jgi:TfoX/Sxy family transcriptional regulator of competence genes
MPYDTVLAQRIRDLLCDQPGLTERKMFGGVGFMLQGNLACGVHKDKLIVRVGPERYQDSLRQPGAMLFDITGKAMSGWVMLAAVSCLSDEVLGDWVAQGVAFARTLPPKA